MSNIDTRELEDMYKAFIDADQVVMKKYINSLSKNPICDLPDVISKIVPGSNFQISKLSKVVYDKSENTLDKLTTVYNSLSTYEDATIIMLINGTRDVAEIYVGVCCREINENGECDIYVRGKQNKTLHSAIIGNFSGTELDRVLGGKPKSETDNELYRSSILETMFNGMNSVTSASGVATFRDEKHLDNSKFVQGIEKLIDSMKDETYSAVFIADVISKNKIEEICASYEDLYSVLVPFSKSSQNIGTTETDTESFISGITDTTNKSVSKATSHGVTKGKSKSKTTGGSAGVSYIVSVNVNRSRSSSENESTAVTDTNTETEGTSRSLTEQNSVAKAFSTSEQLTLSYENKAVTSLLERIDEQIKRLRSCEDYGVFDFGAYFIAEDAATSVTISSIYNSLMRGENSSVEASAINTWENDSANLVMEYLKRMYHPLISRDKNVSGEINDESLIVTPASLVSGSELPIHMGLPKKSISGLPVIECAEFGRDVITYENYDENLKLGNIFHMLREEEMPVYLDRNKLTSHTFVTGSTGAGKSNAIYQIIEEATSKSNSEVKFMVIEPAKGEYKNIFGHRDDVQVYGTNPKLTELLRINPFKFPREIHILEHLDRLVEIFNVCWPMYAAMPAILKDAVERAYVVAGWNLKTSENKYDGRLFPSFSDVLDQIRVVLNESDYSADNKGDYIGALDVRLRSLTNGLNGMIFCQDDLSDEELFDNNVIIDLSRVGSTETKAFIMGLLVMKLQEHRMTSGKRNSELVHITVLEEAHNLLKRTSTEQSSESSNMLGKSVEMLANSIAEMRTYGEGFIIADQSPGLLDMSVIRNTNTKIILRLPDFSDRELVGKAAGLNDDQIIELSKLQKGVAAVYQNDWIDPILCKVSKYPDEEKPYVKVSEYGFDDESTNKTILELIIKEVDKESEKVEFSKFSEKIIASNISAGIKSAMLDYYKTSESKDMDKLQKLTYAFFNSKEAVTSSDQKSDLGEWKTSVLNHLVPSIHEYNQKQVDLIIALILSEHVTNLDGKYEGVLKSHIEVMRHREV